MRAVTVVPERKGSAELLILSLVEPRARHGYELCKLIEERSDGVLTFRAASLYPLLYRLEDRGWIQGRWVEKAGQRRRSAPSSSRAGSIHRLGPGQEPRGRDPSGW